MGFLSDMRDGWLDAGQVHLLRKTEAERRAAAALRAAPAKPSPIMIGYYLNRRTGIAGAPLPYYGERHLIVCGLNGAGKQTRILTQLAMTMRGRSCWWLDVKGTAALQCSAELARHSRLRIVCPYPVLNLTSHGCNPLLARDFDPDRKEFFSAARALAEAFHDSELGIGKYFSDSSVELWTFLIMWEVVCAKREGRKPSLPNAYRTLTEPVRWGPKLDKDGKQIVVAGRGPVEVQISGLQVTIDRMVKEGGPIIAGLASRFQRSAGQDELEGIKSTARTQASFLADPYLADDLEKDGTDLTTLRDVATSVMVVVPPDKLSDARKWIRVLLDCSIRAHVRKGKYSTLFVLDEFRATVAELPVLVKNWAVVREFGIQFMPIVQSLGQLRKAWGDEWEAMVGQAGAVVMLGPTNDKFTADWAAERGGDMIELRAGINASLSSSGNVGDSGGTGTSPNGESTNTGGSHQNGFGTGGGFSVQQVQRRAVLPQAQNSMRPGQGRIFVAGEGTLSIPFVAPNYWNVRAPWVTRVKPNPLFNG